MKFFKDRLGQESREPSYQLRRIFRYVAGVVLAGLVLACRPSVDDFEPRDSSYGSERMNLLDELRSQGIGNENVLDALSQVPRHEFVPRALQDQAYSNRPLPIGHGQTISQPYIVALMTELLQLEPGDRVLEIGTGSGYQAAVLVMLGAEVFTIEIVSELGEIARERLRRLGYHSAQVRIGDGYSGWPEEAPFDAVIVTAAPERIPEALVQQLRSGGRLVVPVGPDGRLQHLELVVKNETGQLATEQIVPVRFVPLVGSDGKQHDD